MTKSMDPLGERESERLSGPSSDADMWSDVGSEWIQGGRDQLWRRHSDAVTTAMIEGWIPAGQNALLKTDLFDEAVSPGLYPALKDLAQDVHAIDVAVDVVDAVRQKYPALHSHVSDIRALPFDDQTFDVVISTSTLDHFETVADIDQSVREIRRVMADGGRLLITLDNPLNPKIALRAALPEQLLMKTGLMPYHCGVTLPRKAMREALENTGFSIIDERAFLHCPRVTAVKLAALINRFAPAHWEGGLHAVLRKFEALERLPTRWRTAHFTALLAEAR